MELSNSILIVDDEENIRKYLGQSLTKDGFEVFTAKYGKEGINLLVQKHIDVVLLDLNLPDMNGLDVLREIKKIDVQAVIIIITAYGEISTAVEATKLGAYEYLTTILSGSEIGSMCLRGRSATIRMGRSSPAAKKCTSCSISSIKLQRPLLR
jgi:DNA-binding NtrC family response regulator